MIRQFRSEDAHPCAELMRACVRGDTSIPQKVRDYLCQCQSAASMRAQAYLFHVVVYEKEGRVCGLAGLDLNEIRLLYVSPEHQGRKLGSALLDHIEAMIPPALFADVFVYSTLSAEGFYRSRGFESRGQCWFDFPVGRMPTVFMWKAAGSRQ
jgi:N-acetylglutamate synthase-like GNAT family acetyltransferase